MGIGAIRSIFSFSSVLEDFFFSIKHHQTNNKPPPTTNDGRIICTECVYSLSLRCVYTKYRAVFLLTVFSFSFLRLHPNKVKSQANTHT